MDVLILRYKKKLLTTVQIQVQDKYIADDVFQDACLKIISCLRRNQFDAAGNFFAWANRIVHNTCIDHWRKERRQPSFTNEYNDELITELHGTAEWADKSLLQNENGEIIKELVEQLPAKQQEAITLRYYEELSFKEISSSTNCNINAALARIHTAIRGLRKMYFATPA